MSLPYSQIMDDIEAECLRSDAVHGDQMELPLGTSADSWSLVAESAKKATDRLASLGLVTWVDIAQEEVAECFAEDDPAKVRYEAVQAAAMFAKIIRKCDLLLEEKN